MGKLLGGKIMEHGFLRFSKIGWMARVVLWSCGDFPDTRRSQADSVPIFSCIAGPGFGNRLMCC